MRDFSTTLRRSPAPPFGGGSASTVHRLDQDVDDVIGRLREAYSDLLSALPDEVGGAIEVERALGLNKKLAWQVYRVATATTPLIAGARVPGTAAARQVVRAARRAGVPSTIIDRIEAGTAAFHETVRRHADDRSSFDLMVSAVSGDGLAARDEDLKRSAFRANRQLLGRYCDVDVYTLLAVPGRLPGTVHMCALRGLIGLRRLRPRVRLEISRHRYDRSGSDGGIGQRRTLDGDPVDEHTPIPVLHEFSSKPLPAIHQSTAPDGFVRSSLETSSLGLRSSATCFLADVNHDSEYRSADGSAGIGHIHRVATPARLLLQDVLIDERLVGDRGPELRILASASDAEAWPGDDPSAVLPIHESVDRMGRGPAAIAAPEVPRYRAMIEHVTDRLGWDADRLMVHRARIDHPVLHSVVWMRFDLGEAGPGGGGLP
jgi:hypothetical protein